MRSAKTQTLSVCPACDTNFTYRDLARTADGKLKYRKVGPRVGSKTPDHGWLSLDPSYPFSSCRGVGKPLVGKVVPKKVAKK